MKIRTALVLATVSAGTMSVGALGVVSAGDPPCKGSCHQPLPTMAPSTLPAPTTTLATDECPTLRARGC